MSFFGGGSSSGHGHGHSNHHSSSHNNSFFGGGSSSRPGYARSSSSGIFSRGGSSSYYKRRPRDGYISYLVNKLKRLIADLWVYARRHPVKAFFAIVVPLISAGGALHGLLKQFGIRLPAVFDGMSRTTTTSYRGGYYGSNGYGSNGYGSSGYGSGMGGAGGAMGTMGNLFQIAKAFM